MSQTKKLMFISDIHGSEYYFKKALEIYKKEIPYKLIVLGDILYHGPRNPLPEGYNPKEVIELINPLKNDIISVRGNCEAEVDQMVLDFPILGDYHILDFDDHEFFLTHGHLYNNEPSPLCKKETIFCQGHTHIPMIDMKNTIVHFNPGSITLPKDGHPNTYGIYENNTITIKKLDGHEYMVKKL
ncbi:phosphodiesterase [Spirochaeta cellobiosiphila]|uniref:phosphodiesterase n=1 Tax=Spirochaeta cellobiosiphila TaxID=504483 RepID=UPI0003F91D29|nr:phosphodiesterase [Spirochaeta cellobiosiphila]